MAFLDKLFGKKKRNEALQAEEAIKNMSNGNLGKKLENLDANHLNEQLQNNPELLKQLSQNPELMQKLTSIIKNK